MKTTLIHRRLYAESLRRLRLPMILLAVIPAAITVLVQLYDILDSYYTLAEGYTLSTHSYDSFIEVCWFLPALPFVVPVILSAVLFSQQNKRCDSDFYHSLPLTKRQLNATWFLAVATGTALVVLASSLVVLAVDLLNPSTRIPAWDAVVPPVLGACLAALMVASVLFLSYQISGNSVSALFTAAILLFAPHLITMALSEPIANNISVVSVETLNTFQYFTLFWQYEGMAVWIVSILATVVCALLGLWASARRPSEAAGQAAVSKVLQIILRLSAAFVACLPAIIIITNDPLYNIEVILLFYGLALAVYFLFELFTTKKARNMLKAIPWLVILAVLNVIAVLGIQMSVYTINRFRPEAEEIENVSVTRLIHYDYYDLGYAEDACIANTRFDLYAAVYNRSDCTEVKLTDELSREIVATALEDNLDQNEEYESGSYGYSIGVYDGYAYEYMDYLIEVEIDTGLMTRSRLIWVNNGQLKALLTAINAQETLPVLKTNFGIEYQPSL